MNIFKERSKSAHLRFPLSGPQWLFSAPRTPRSSWWWPETPPSQTSTWSRFISRQRATCANLSASLQLSPFTSSPSRPAAPASGYVMRFDRYSLCRMVVKIETLFIYCRRRLVSSSMITGCHPNRKSRLDPSAWLPGTAAMSRFCLSLTPTGHNMNDCSPAWL